MNETAKTFELGGAIPAKPRRKKKGAIADRGLTWRQDAAGLWVYLVTENRPVFLGRIGHDRPDDAEAVRRYCGDPIAFP